MNVRLSILVFVMGFAGGSLAGNMPASAPAVGERAPDFALADQNGKTFRLKDARGQKAVLVFYRGYW